MIVLGSESFVFEWSGRTCKVNPFTSTLGSMSNVPIVDGAIAYDCPYTHMTYILLCRNALYIPSMRDNLIPPFIVRESGATVNDTAKIHCEDPSPDHHCIIFADSDLRIPLNLNGTFSFFHTRMPTQEELQDCEKIFITPDNETWNPYCTSFELNERSMLDHNGEMTDPKRRSNFIVDHEREDPDIASVTVASMSAIVDRAQQESFMEVEVDEPQHPDSNFA